MKSYFVTLITPDNKSYMSEEMSYDFAIDTYEMVMLTISRLRMYNSKVKLTELEEKYDIPTVKDLLESTIRRD